MGPHRSWGLATDTTVDYALVGGRDTHWAE